MTQYARVEDKAADLSSDFGRDYAMKTFALSLEDLEKLVGRYTRGARKGQLRGRLVWGVVTAGGWVKRFGGGGFVVRPGLRYGHAIVDSWNGKVFLGVDPQRTPLAERISYAARANRAEAVEAPKPDTLSADEMLGFYANCQLAGCSLDQAASVLAYAYSAQS